MIASMRGHKACLFAASALLLMASGCATSSAPPLSSAEMEQGLQAYRLGAGDKLRISVYNEPSLSGEYTVSTSGDIAFPLIGSVQVGTSTVHDVIQTLTARIKDGYMTDPRVSVEVMNYRPFYILGEVQKPGEYPYVAGLTMEQAIAAAGGFNYRANNKRVNVRRGRDPVEKSVELYSNTVISVMPGDTIRVLERYF